MTRSNNSQFLLFYSVDPNSVRRARNLMESKGIMFIGMGISGGEEGARNGPSLMPGGPKDAYDEVEKILTLVVQHK